jgi:hypothetical protein
MSDAFGEASPYYLVGRPPYSQQLLPVLRRELGLVDVSDMPTTVQKPRIAMVGGLEVRHMVTSTMESRTAGDRQAGDTPRVPLLAGSLARRALQTSRRQTTKSSWTCGLPGFSPSAEPPSAEPHRFPSWLGSASDFQLSVTAPGVFLGRPGRARASRPTFQGHAARTAFSALTQQRPRQRRVCSGASLPSSRRKARSRRRTRRRQRRPASSRGHRRGRSWRPPER